VTIGARAGGRRETQKKKQRKGERRPASLLFEPRWVRERFGERKKKRGHVLFTTSGRRRDWGKKKRKGCAPSPERLTAPFPEGRGRERKRKKERKERKPREPRRRRRTPTTGKRIAGEKKGKKKGREKSHAYIGPFFTIGIG